MMADKHNVSGSANVVIPKIGSQLSQEASKSFELKSLVKNNFELIKSNAYKDKSIGLNFKQTPELQLTIGKSELYCPQINKDGSFSGFIIDKYDFSKLKHDLSDGIKQAGVSFINNNAYQQQQHKLMNNYVIIVPVRIEKTELDKILHGK